MDLIKLVKDGNTITADRSQLAAMKADGWCEPGDLPQTTEGDSDGGNEPRGSLDSEQRSGEDGQESVDDPVG